MDKFIERIDLSEQLHKMSDKSNRNNITNLIRFLPRFY
jgi:hypothetical protein